MKGEDNAIIWFFKKYGEELFFGLFVIALVVLVWIFIHHAEVQDTRDQRNAWSGALHRVSDACGAESVQLKAFRLLRSQSDGGLTRDSRRIAAGCLHVNPNDYQGD